MNPEFAQENFVKKKAKELVAEKEIRQIGGARELKFGLEPAETVRRSTGPLGEDGQTIGAEVVADRYNQSEPIQLGDMQVMAVREEPHGSEDSCTKFFRRGTEDLWQVITDADQLTGCQDPSYQGEIYGQKYLSVVNTRVEDDGSRSYWSELYELNDKLKDLKKVAESPLFCKGLHLCPVPDDGIDGFIRPQRGKYGRGKICYFHIESIEELQGVLDNIENKTEIIDIFDEEEWGGVNDVHRLDDGRIDVLGHIAESHIDEEGIERKSYYVTHAFFDPRARQMEDLTIIMTLDDLKAEDGLVKDHVKAKNPMVENVLYPTNSVIDENGYHVYVGVKDAKPYVFTVEKRGEVSLVSTF